ncbi:MAG: hypothetical protein K0S11_561 [Gammaproteobacteria bacterium]|jgi:hypothetical protein|nr:hypothetical protein [Gammaproteobacteria bacterium]
MANSRRQQGIINRLANYLAMLYHDPFLQPRIEVFILAKTSDIQATNEYNVNNLCSEKYCLGSPAITCTSHRCYKYLTKNSQVRSLKFCRLGSIGIALF